MAFLTLQDLSGTCEVIVFPELYKSAGAKLAKDSIIFVRGKINAREDVPKIIAEEIVAIDDVKTRFTRFISIDLQTAGLESEILSDIKKVLLQHKGNTPVYLSFKDPLGKSAVIHSGDSLKVKTTDDLLSSLEKILGENAVKIR